MKTDKGFEIQTEMGDSFSATKLVFATGITQLPFEQNFTIAEQLGCELTEEIDAFQKKTTKNVFA